MVGADTTHDTMVDSPTCRYDTNINDNENDEDSYVENLINTGYRILTTGVMNKNDVNQDDKTDEDYDSNKE